MQKQFFTETDTFWTYCIADQANRSLFRRTIFEEVNAIGLWKRKSLIKL